MRRNLPTLLALLTLAAPLAGQAKPGHRYAVGYYQALPGKFDALRSGSPTLCFRSPTSW
jgi:hypothetical protein